MAAAVHPSVEVNARSLPEGTHPSRAVKPRAGIALAPAGCWGLVLLGAACATTRPTQPSVEAGRIYEGTEEQTRVQVTEWFGRRGIRLEPSTEVPHVLVSGLLAQESSKAAPTLPSDAAGASSRFGVNESSSRELSELVADARAEPAPAKGGATMGLVPDRLLLELPTDPAAPMQSFQGWRVELEPISAQRTRVRVYRTVHHAWAAAADATKAVTATPTPSPTPSRTTFRDEPMENALAEVLDRGVVVQVLGDAVTSSLLEIEPLVDAPGPSHPEAPTATTEPAAAKGPDRRLEGCGPGTLFLPEGDFGPGQVVLLSAVDGTHEGPKALTRLAHAASCRGLSVTVALSIPASEQERLNRFLGSAGLAADVEDLAKGEFWRRQWQDGRSSLALLDALKALRQLRHQGLPLAVLAIDVDVAGNPRTAFMSQRVLAHRRRFPDRLLLVSVSNTLAAVRYGNDWDKEFMSLGYRLASAPLPVHSYDVAFLAGRHWSCRLSEAGTLRCGTWWIRPGPLQRAPVPTPLVLPHVEQFLRRSEHGFDGRLFVGALSPAPPAVSGIAPDEGTARLVR